ncbi:response regulator [bacterium]|nr:response regulator [bacterium]
MESKIGENSASFLKGKGIGEHPETDGSLSESGAGNIQILLIEDDEIPRRLVYGFLKNEKCLLSHVKNGQEAIKIMSEKSFDLILTDMEMPIMDGYEIICHIRQNPKWKKLPIIAITANTMQSDIEKCLSAGCTDYLIKPINKKALLEKIGCCLSKHEDGKDPETKNETPMNLRFTKDDKNQLFCHSGKDRNPEFLDEKPCEFAEDLKELFPFYLDSLKEDLSKVKTAYQQLDFESIRFIGHNNKGSGRLYGLNDLSRVCEKLEKAALDKDEDAIKDLISEMERLYEIIRPR